jgi:hypothetical protein
MPAKSSLRCALKRLSRLSLATIKAIELLLAGATIVSSGCNSRNRDSKSVP